MNQDEVYIKAQLHLEQLRAAADTTRLLRLREPGVRQRVAAFSDAG